MPGTHASGHLTYYHFVTPPREKKGTDWVSWTTRKAAELWAGFGKAPEGHWKVRLAPHSTRPMCPQ